MNDKKCILIVDDNEEFTENLSDVLDLNGYDVLTANDGFKALKILKEYDIDLALMDVMMPKMNGVKTFKKFKKIAPEIPVIMISAFAVEDLIIDALYEGAFGFLYKPVEFNKLFSIINTALPDGLLIMVVDDNEDFCANMKEILTDKGYKVNIAFDGEIAIIKAREKKFDVIIMDLKMPNLNGLDTYLSIRRFRPSAIVIAITGEMIEMDAIAKEIVARNACICLEKPLDIDRLVNFIEEIQ